MSVASELTRQHLEEMQGFYDTAAVAPNSAASYYRQLLAHYYNLLMPAGASVLEIGCGSGELLARLQAGRKVGIDLSAAQ
jgi:cyclopropane fatty-acyl-phospholipid synthase-like methyltransferase